MLPNAWSDLQSVRTVSNFFKLMLIMVDFTIPEDLADYGCTEYSISLARYLSKGAMQYQQSLWLR